MTRYPSKTGRIACSFTKPGRLAWEEGAGIAAVEQAAKLWLPEQVSGLWLVGLWVVTVLTSKGKRVCECGVQAGSG